MTVVRNLYSSIYNHEYPLNMLERQWYPLGYKPGFATELIFITSEITSPLYSRINTGVA